MRIYLKKNVYDAALDRIRWLYDEFPVVICDVSGGKDSTVVFHLCLQVAREKNRLPLIVRFLDQEAEWQATIDQVRLMMEHPDVQPMWMQIPFKLFNATSAEEHWLQCWNPEDEYRWMRPKESYSLKENVYGTDRFGGMFDAISKYHWPDTPAVTICGVRCEESPNRTLGLTSCPTYKGRTWGRKVDEKRGHFNMYPLYDWTYNDVWAAIHRNKWPYNKIYDAQYSRGVTVMDMRVSNIHHETAVHSLFYLQEVEPQTYVKLTQRIKGIDMAGKMGKDDYFVHELPPMFASWFEYRDHLLKNLIQDESWREKMAKEFARMEESYLSGGMKEQTLCMAQIQSILTNDHEFVKLKNFERKKECMKIRRIKAGKIWRD